MAENTQGKSFTEASIRDRLGASTIVYHYIRLGAAEIAEMGEAGIRRIELCGLPGAKHFDHTDRDHVKEIMSECRIQGITIPSAHGPQLKFESTDQTVRKEAVAAGVESARVAEEMGASVYVGHFGISEESEKSVCEMLEELEGSEIKLAVENGEDLNDFAAFVDKIGSDRMGMVVDIGHTRDGDDINPFTQAEHARDTIKICGDRLMHLHLHDFAEHDHYPPFDGSIEWGELFAGLQEMGYQGELMFEALDRVSFQDTLVKTAAFPQGYIERYGKREKA